MGVFVQHRVLNFSGGLRLCHNNIVQFSCAALVPVYCPELSIHELRLVKPS